MATEEENYVRLSLLLTGMSPRAVRCTFDKEFAPAALPATIKKEYHKLNGLKGKRIISRAQWNMLHPRNGIPDSKHFDITLMICLLRNLTTITPPSLGFDCLPPSGETTEGADLARIKFYRNYLAHLDETKIDTSYFTSAWTDVADAVGRLGGMVQECQILKVKILDQSNKEIMLEIKQSKEEIKDLKQSHEGLQEEMKTEKKKHKASLKKLNDCLQSKIDILKEARNDPVPWNIREQITEKLSSWREDDKAFVVTRAAKHVLKCLKSNHCVSVTGSPGMGKTATVRHVALQMQGEGYDIIPLAEPGDIVTFYHPNQKTLYVVDDFCGTYNLNVGDFEKWKKLIEDLKKRFEKKLTKVIVTCRLQVYQDEKFDTLSLFKSCECNLLSDDLSLLQTEKQSIAELYLGTKSAKTKEYNDLYDCFPLLCKLYKVNMKLNIEKFFQNPFSVYETEVEKLRTEGGVYKYCALALCVMFNNHLNREWLTGEVDKDVQTIIKNTCEGCKLNRGTSRLQLCDELDSLVHTFIKKRDGVYSAIHDRLFDFLAYYFGKVMISLLIRNAESDFIHVRFLFERQEDSDQFIIIVPPQYQVMYIQRMFDDWTRGQVVNTFFNRNMTNKTFREKFKQHLNGLQLSHQRQLVHQRDVHNKDSVLTWCCYTGDTDMVHWCMDHGVNVNYCGCDGCSALYLACEKGHVEVVKMLLNSNADINKCTDDETSPLYIACNQGHVEVVKILLNSKADIYKCTDDETSPLYIACEEGHVEIVKLLLNSKADINKCTDVESSPLFIASQEGHVEVVKMLLNSKADINKCRDDGASPLYIACVEGHKEVVKILLNSKADINKCTGDETTPLFIACQEGHVEVVKMLLNSKADINKCRDIGTSPLYIACQVGHVEVVNILLNSKADINKCRDTGESPLYIACQEGHVEVVNILLNSKADINKCRDTGESPLYFACQEGHVEVVKILLNSKADINKCRDDGASPLYIACVEGHKEVVKILLNSKADINKCTGDETTPLFFACQEGHVEVVKILLNSKADINKCTGDETTPLFIACQEGHVEVVKMLLNSKADINKCTDDETSPLYIACQDGHVEVVKMLLNNKADINKCTDDETSPLYIACKDGHVEVVKMLLNNKADINKCTYNECSPLYIACENGHVEVVKILLNSKADINKRTDSGESPLFVACESGHLQTVELLLQRGADYTIGRNDEVFPVEIARMNGHNDIVTILLKKV